jgi:bacteriocin biosynthesis cyclodehydratase domain-containing protein
MSPPPHRSQGVQPSSRTTTTSGTGPPAGSGLAARLNPATRILWRSPDSVQLELGRRAVVLDGVDGRDVRELLGSAPGSPDSRLEPATAALIDAGFLWTDPVRAPTPSPRLAGELSALRIRHGQRAATLLSARARSRVLITGPGRLGPTVGALLAAAGVGDIHIAGSGPVQLRATMPGGLAAADEGRDFQLACAELLRAAAPEVRTSPPPADEQTDLVIIAEDGPVDEDLQRALHDRAQAHLVVRCGGDHLVVGPLVLPGLTSCLHCADLHRIDRDPAWSALAVQLAATTKYPPASEVALASLAASLGATHALAFLDGEEPACIDGTLELDHPDWRLRRRSWSARPDCSCVTAQ